MLRYETLILSSTHITNDELSMMEDFFDKLSAKAKGKVFTFDYWGKQHLSYPIKKNNYGTYLLVRYELVDISNFFKELDSFLKIKCNDFVLRSVTIKLDPKKGFEYKKPESVNVRSGNIDSFIKENKIDKFLDTNKKDDNSEVTKSNESLIDEQKAEKTEVTKEESN